MIINFRIDGITECGKHFLSLIRLGYEEVVSSSTMSLSIMLVASEVDKQAFGGA